VSVRLGLGQKEIGDIGRPPPRGAGGSVCWQSSRSRRAPRYYKRLLFAPSRQEFNLIINH
jgi:hypothetical protein